MNTLKKVGVLSYYPEMAAVTGTPAFYRFETVPVTVTKESNGILYESVVYEKRLVYYPEVPTKPAVPASSSIDLKTGWNAGAVSRVSYQNECEFSFSISMGIIGCISGLSDGANKRNYSHIAHGFLFIQNPESDTPDISIIESGVIKQQLQIYTTDQVRFVVRVIDGTVHYLINVYGSEYYELYSSPLLIKGNIYAEALLYMVDDSVNDAKFVSLSNKLNGELIISGGFTNRDDNYFGGPLYLASDFTTGNYFFNGIPPIVGELREASGFFSEIAISSDFMVDNTPQIQVGTLFSPVPSPLQLPSLAINGGLGYLEESPLSIGCFMSDRAYYGELKISPLPLPINRFYSLEDEEDQITHQESIITDCTNVAEHAVLILFTETLWVNQTIELGLVLNIADNETLQLNDAISFSGVIELLIQEKIKLLSNVSPTNKPSYQYAVNASTYALSLYDNFDFISFARCNGMTYGIKSDGLYRLTGNTDNGQPITCEIDMGAKDWGVPNSKRVSSAYLGIRTDGEAYLKVVVDDRYTNIYRFEQAQSQARSFMAKGVTGRYWRMKLTLEAASFAELDSMEFEVGLSQRRINK